MMQSSVPLIPPQVKVELVSNPLYLAGVRELVSNVAKRLGFPDEAASQMALAVDEALCNVIRHGYGKQGDRPIWLSIWQEGGTASHPEALRIVIEDEARQVDPATIRSRNLDDVRPGGLGVHIIQSVMDEAKYERRERAGMRLVMVKKRASTLSGERATIVSGVQAMARCCGDAGGAGGSGRVGG